MDYVDVILDEYGSVFLIKDYIKLKINNLELYRYFSSFGMSHLQFRKEELPGKLKQFDFEKNKSESYFSKKNSLIDFIKRNYFYDIKLYSDNPKNPIESWENKTEKIKIAKSAEILWSEVANFSSISKSPYYCLLYNLKNTENYILIISKTYFSAIQKMVSYNLNNYFELEDVCCKSIVSKRELIENSININKSKMKLLYACEGSKGYTRRVFKYNNIFVGQLEFHSNIIFSEIALNELSIVKLLDSVESVLSEQLFGKLNWDNLFVVLSDDFNDYLDINESQKYYSNGSLRGLELCRQGRIDCIHTKSISRFARNTETILSVSRELKLLGVDIFFEEQNIHTLSSEGEVMLTVLASYAEEELTSHSFNVRWGYQRKFQRGEFHVNAKRFLGYDVEDGQLVINQQEAEIVRHIFESYVSGKGANRIVKELNANKVPTVTNRQWHESTIRNLLSNEKYKGDWHFQKFYTPSLGHHTLLNKGSVDSYYMEEHHPAIVSKELWQQAQECRQKRQGSNSPNDYTKRYPYTGKLFCPYCEKALRRQLPYRTPTWICAT